MATGAPRRSGTQAARRRTAAAPDPILQLEGFTPAARPSVLEVMARRPLPIVLLTVLTAVAAYLIARVQEPEYRATARVFLVDPNRELGLDVQRPAYLDPRRSTRTKAEIALSGPVLRNVAKASGLSLDEVRDRVDAVPLSEADVFTITATSGSADEATRLVRLTESAYAAVSRRVQEAPFRRALADIAKTRRALGRDARTAGPAARARIQTRLRSLADREAELRSNMALLSSGIQAFEDPVRPDVPVAPRPLRSAAVGAMLGFLAAIALLWFRAGRRAPASHPDLAAARLGAPLIGELPERDAPWHRETRSGIEDAYRRLAHALEKRTRGNAVVVTGARPEDLSRGFSERVAAAAAELGWRALVVDGDPVKGRREAGRTPGAWDIAVGEAGAETLARVPVSGTSRYIDFLPAGAAAYRQADDARGADASRLESIFHRFDLVLVSGPALESVVDARMPPLPEGTTAIVLVGRNTPLRSLWELRSRLDVLGLRLVGFVFDNGAAPDGLLARLRSL